MYPQIKYADVPTRTTPEQTYAKFREALRTNNLEMALEQLDLLTSRYKDNKKTIEQAYKENKFKEAYNSYPEKIEKESMSETLATYYYFINKEGKNFRTYLGFTKNQNGDWLITEF
jgi:hypothetical protein